MSDSPVTLEFLARQQAQLLASFADLKADLGVLTAMVIRVDNTLSSMVQQLDVMHADNRRTRDRVAALESRAP
jgi:hypothetical protein